MAKTNLKKIRNLFLLLLTLAPFSVFSTIIIPPDNIGEMAKNSDIVVYGTVVDNYDNDLFQNVFKIDYTVKGNVKKGDFVIIDEYSKSFGEYETRVAGDFDFELNKKYLVFLSEQDNGHYKLRLLSFSAFKQIVYKNKAIFAHSENIYDIHKYYEKEDSPGIDGAYLVQPLISHLYDVVNHNVLWSEDLAGRVQVLSYDRSTDKDNGLESREVSASCPNERPSHCTVVNGNATSLSTTCTDNSPSKYENNTWTVYVAGGAQEDPSTTTESADLQNAVDAMHDLNGINITYGGVEADFSVGSCSSVQSLRLSHAGDLNAVYVFFDDPCSQIEDLSNCSGVLGIGGHYAYDAPGCHEDACGNKWRGALYPFFVMNNGSGCVDQGTYTAVLIHEMLHSLGMGHIAGTCTAVMNPMVCNASAPSASNNYNISSLDEECIDWMYNITEALPIELIDVNAYKNENSVNIDWTAEKLDKDIDFVVEKSDESFNWLPIDMEDMVIDDEDKNFKYSITDNEPFPGISYYRLKQIRADGTFNYSRMVSVEFELDDALTAYPNPFTNTIDVVGNILNNSNKIIVYNTIGKIVYSQDIRTSINKLTLDLSDFSESIYFLVIKSKSSDKVLKISKSPLK